MLAFKFLAQSLHEVAKTAASHFRKHHGVKDIKAETEVETDIAYRPTLIGRTQDYYTLCVEVTDVGFSGSLEAFVAACGNRGLPVKCFVAVPKGIDDGAFRIIQRKAKGYGVGLVEVNGVSCSEVHGAMPMTMFGYRRPNPSKFPPKYRQAIADAETVLRSGDPAKACSNIYDEIERVTREVAKEVTRRGLWRPLLAGEKRPKVKLDKGPWLKVMELLEHHLDYSKLGHPELNSALIAKVLGLVPHRNDTGHKPANKNALLKRDQELRTRFEHAVDTLRELVVATRFLKV